jgi:hypothetical protein
LSFGGKQIVLKRLADRAAFRDIPLWDENGANLMPVNRNNNNSEISYSGA